MKRYDEALYGSVLPLAQPATSDGTEDGHGSILDALADVVRTAPREALPSILGRLAEAEARTRLRLATPPEAPSSQAEPQRLLTVPEAAAQARVSERWLLRHTRGLRFRRDLSRKAVRFEESGLRRWLLAQGRHA